MNLQLPQNVEIKGIRVLTSKQLAEAYQTTADTIKTNFNANRNRYVEEKHYIALTGDELKKFKKQVRNPYLVANRASHLYLWTEKGALLHAKSLNTDKAWEVYDYLVDFYFQAKEERKVPVTVETKTIPVRQSKSNIREVVDVPENPEILNAIKKIRDDLVCMDVLLQYSIRYTEEKEYYKTQKAAAEVLPIIVQDWNKLFDTKPKIVQKQY